MKKVSSVECFPLLTLGGASDLANIFHKQPIRIKGGSQVMCDVVNYCYAHIHACCICQFMCFCSIVAVCLLFSIHYLIPGRGAKYCHPCICLSSVCRFLSSLHVYISQKSLVQISGNFLYILPVAKAWSSSDDRAICYVIPVL